MGYISDDVVSAVEPEYIESFLEQPSFQPQADFTKPSFYVVCMDPNNSDSVNSSEMALFAMTHISGKKVVSFIS